MVTSTARCCHPVVSSVTLTGRNARSLAYLRGFAAWFTCLAYLLSRCRSATSSTDLPLSLTDATLIMMLHYDCPVPYRAHRPDPLPTYPDEDATVEPHPDDIPGVPPSTVPASPGRHDPHRQPETDPVEQPLR